MLGAVLNKAVLNRERRGQRIWALVAIILALGMSAAMIFAPVDWTELGSAGYAGVFVVTLVATGALVAPLPYFVAIGLAATYLNPALVALVAAVAATFGEMTGYLLGVGGRSYVPDAKWVARIEGWLRRWGLLGIIVLSLIPNPLFDAVGFVAGALGFGPRTFAAGVFVGKLIRFIAIAYFGFGLSVWRPWG